MERQCLQKRAFANRTLKSLVFKIYHQVILIMGFPGGSMVKNLPANTGDTGDSVLIPGSGRSPGEGNGNPPHYSCLENSMDRRAWKATVHGVAKSWTQLSMQILYNLWIKP